jgi:predicted transcriptional regulator
MPDRPLRSRSRRVGLLYLVMGLTAPLELARGNPMARAIPKEEVRRLLETIPDEASYEDIQYHIYVQQKIDRGLEAAERGDFISDEEIEQRQRR